MTLVTLAVAVTVVTMCVALAVQALFSVT